MNYHLKEQGSAYKDARHFVAQGAFMEDHCIAVGLFYDDDNSLWVIDELKAIESCKKHD